MAETKQDVQAVPAPQQPAEGVQSDSQSAYSAYTNYGYGYDYNTGQYDPAAYAEYCNAYNAYYGYNQYQYDATTGQYNYNNYYQAEQAQQQPAQASSQPPLPAGQPPPLSDHPTAVQTGSAVNSYQTSHTRQTPIAPTPLPNAPSVMHNVQSVVPTGVAPVTPTSVTQVSSQQNNRLTPYGQNISTMYTQPINTMTPSSGHSAMPSMGSTNSNTQSYASQQGNYSNNAYSQQYNQFTPALGTGVPQQPVQSGTNTQMTSSTNAQSNMGQQYGQDFSQSSQTGYQGNSYSQSDQQYQYSNSQTMQQQTDNNMQQSIGQIGGQQYNQNQQQYASHSNPYINQQQTASNQYNKNQVTNERTWHKSTYSCGNEAGTNSWDSTGAEYTTPTPDHPSKPMNVPGRGNNRNRGTGKMTRFQENQGRGRGRSNRFGNNQGIELNTGHKETEGPMDQPLDQTQTVSEQPKEKIIFNKQIGPADMSKPRGTFAALFGAVDFDQDEYDQSTESESENEDPKTKKDLSKPAKFCPKGTAATLPKETNTHNAESSENPRMTLAFMSDMIDSSVEKNQRGQSGNKDRFSQKDKPLPPMNVEFDPQSFGLPTSFTGKLPRLEESEFDEPATRDIFRPSQTRYGQNRGSKNDNDRKSGRTNFREGSSEYGFNDRQKRDNRLDRSGNFQERKEWDNPSAEFDSLDTFDSKKRSDNQKRDNRFGSSEFEENKGWDDRSAKFEPPGVYGIDMRQERFDISSGFQDRQSQRWNDHEKGIQNFSLASGTNRFHDSATRFDQDSPFGRRIEVARTSSFGRGRSKEFEDKNQAFSGRRSSNDFMDNTTSFGRSAPMNIGNRSGRLEDGEPNFQLSKPYVGKGGSQKIRDDCNEFGRPTSICEGIKDEDFRFGNQDQSINKGPKGHHQNQYDAADDFENNQFGGPFKTYDRNSSDDFLMGRNRSLPFCRPEFDKPSSFQGKGQPFRRDQDPFRKGPNFDEAHDSFMDPNKNWPEGDSKYGKNTRPYKRDTEQTQDHLDQWFGRERKFQDVTSRNLDNRPEPFRERNNPPEPFRQQNLIPRPDRPEPFRQKNNTPRPLMELDEPLSSREDLMPCDDPVTIYGKQNQDSLTENFPRPAWEASNSQMRRGPSILPQKLHESTANRQRIGFTDKPAFQPSTRGWDKSETVTHQHPVSVTNLVDSKGSKASIQSYTPEPVTGHYTSPSSRKVPLLDVSTKTGSFYDLYKPPFSPMLIDKLKGSKNDANLESSFAPSPAHHQPKFNEKTPISDHSGPRSNFSSQSRSQSQLPNKSGFALLNKPGFSSQPPCNPGFTSQSPYNSGFTSQPPYNPGFTSQPPNKPGFTSQTTSKSSISSQHNKSQADGKSVSSCTSTGKATSALDFLQKLKFNKPQVSLSMPPKTPEENKKPIEGIAAPDKTSSTSIPKSIDQQTSKASNFQSGKPTDNQSFKNGSSVKPLLAQPSVVQTTPVPKPLSKSSVPVIPISSVPSSTRTGKMTAMETELQSILDQVKDPGLKYMTQHDVCRLCTVSLTSTPMAIQHYNGKAHAKKLKLYEDGIAAKGISPGTITDTQVPASASVSVNKDDPKVYCSKCEASFENPDKAEDHYKSPAHVNKISVNSTKSSTVFSCDICDISVSSQASLNSHLNGAKHNSKVQATPKVDNVKGQSVNPGKADPVKGGTIADTDTSIKDITKVGADKEANKKIIMGGNNSGIINLEKKTPESSSEIDKHKVKTPISCSDTEKNKPTDKPVIKSIIDIDFEGKIGATRGGNNSSGKERGRGGIERGRGSIERGRGGIERGRGGMERGRGGMEKGRGGMERGRGGMEIGRGGMERGRGGMERGRGGLEREWRFLDHNRGSRGRGFGRGFDEPMGFGEDFHGRSRMELLSSRGQFEDEYPLRGHSPMEPGFRGMGRRRPEPFMEIEQGFHPRFDPYDEFGGPPPRQRPRFSMM